MSISHQGSFHNIMVLHIMGVPITDVVIDGGSKQVWFLGHNSNFATQPGHIQLAQFHTIQQNLNSN
jgi:hypothetical protein